jgi:hypothetical protein
MSLRKVAEGHRTGEGDMNCMMGFPKVNRYRLPFCSNSKFYHEGHEEHEGFDPFYDLFPGYLSVPQLTGIVDDVVNIIDDVADIVDDVTDIVGDISDLVKDSSTFITTFMLLVPGQFF